MRIAMIGTGYVGLVSGACFSEFGVSVTCVDKDAEKIARLQRGEMPIFEAGLERLVSVNAAAGRLSFTTDLRTALDGADAVFIAVGTPSRRGDGHADLSYVFAAAAEIADTLAQLPSNRTVVVTKSTVPVGTGRRVERILSMRLPAGDFDVASNPEFLREGSAIQDFMRPDRVVIGTDSEHARTVLRALYRPLYLLETPIVFTTIETAELIKYAANAFLATKITFINEVADLCEAVGADVQDVARGIGLDGRIGRKFLHAGPGFGGSCFPKDCQALVRTAEQAETPLAIVETVLRVNEDRKRQMAERIAAACGGSVEGLTLAALGLTYKPNTDDMRDSPSLTFLPALHAAGATIRAFDPEGMAEAKKLMPELDYCDDAYQAINGADALVLITEWNEFRGLDLGRVKQLLRQPLVIDLRNIYKPEEMLAAGLVYHSIGRPSGIPNTREPTALRAIGCPGHAKQPEGHPDAFCSEADPGHRRGRVSRLASVRAPHCPRPRRVVRRQLLHRPQGQHRASVARPALRGGAPRRDTSAVRRGRRDPQPRLSGVADPLPIRPDADDQDQRHRRDHHARPRQAAEGQGPAGLDLSRVRRSDPASAAGKLPRQRQPDRAARLLRRGQALRRHTVFRLLPPAQSADSGGADLQYLWPADAPK